MNKKFKNVLLVYLILISIYSFTSWSHTVMIPFSKNFSQFENRAIQLEQIANVHGKLISQLQQQLIENQRDIDVLRGHLQESQYQLFQIIQQLNELKMQGHGLKQLQKIPHRDNSNANTNYTIAVKLLLNEKKFLLAEQLFQKFIDTSPDSIYLPNANYWLGQINYYHGKKIKAASFFAKVVKDYPQSQKASDALLKIGLIMQEQGNKDQAKIIYNKVCTNYPNVAAAKQAQQYLLKL